MKKFLGIVFISFLVSLLPISPLLAISSAKNIELSFSHSIPSTIPVAKVYQKWAENISQKTNGKVKINFYWTHSLLKDTEMYRGLKNDTSDMGVYYLGIDQGIMPGNMLLLLGFPGYPSMIAARDIYMELYDKYPQLRDEFEGLKIIALDILPGTHISFSKKNIRVPQDMKGLKMITHGSVRQAEVAALGAVPIQLSAGDYYVSIERGLADGIVQHLPVLHAFGVLGELKYNTLFGAGMAMYPSFILMNADVWNGLPDDIQKVFENERDWLERTLIKGNEGYTGMCMGLINKEGHTINALGPQEIELWEKAVQPVHDKIIKETEAKGFPARNFYEDIRRLAIEYSK